MAAPVDSRHGVGCLTRPGMMLIVETWMTREIGGGHGSLASEPAQDEAPGSRPASSLKPDRGPASIPIVGAVCDGR